MRALGRLAIIVAMLLVGVTLAYDKNHPAYLFKAGAPEHIKAELLVGLLRKFLNQVNERFIDPSAETGLPISASEDEPKRAWEYWLGRAREQLCLAEFALGMMQEHRLGFKRVEVNDKEFRVRVNPLVL